MAKIKKTPGLTRAQLEENKTVYTIKGGGWLENYLGHGKNYKPVEEGAERVTIELIPAQAEYYVSSGQIEPIPGETKGYPVDGTTGEALELSAEERAKIEASPSFGQGQSAEEVAGDQAPQASLVEEPADATTGLSTIGSDPGKARRSVKQ
jgi:hypothetical protein